MLGIPRQYSTVLFLRRIRRLSRRNWCWTLLSIDLRNVDTSERFVITFISRRQARRSSLDFVILFRARHQPDRPVRWPRRVDSYLPSHLRSSFAAFQTANLNWADTRLALRCNERGTLNAIFSVFPRVSRTSARQKARRLFRAALRAWRSILNDRKVFRIRGRRRKLEVFF